MILLGGFFEGGDRVYIKYIFLKKRGRLKNLFLLKFKNNFG